MRALIVVVVALTTAGGCALLQEAETHPDHIASLASCVEEVAEHFPSPTRTWSNCVNAYHNLLDDPEIRARLMEAEEVLHQHLLHVVDGHSPDPGVVRQSLHRLIEYLHHRATGN